MGIIYETSLGVFLLVTVFLGGGAAYMAGRAVAITWGSLTYVVVYSLLLAAAARFIHYSLYNGTLLSPQYFLVDLIVLLALAGLGFRVTRAGQMSGQYAWIYERTGPLSWRQRQAAPELKK